MSEIIMLHKKEKGKILQVPSEISFLTLKDEYEACSFYNTAAKLTGNPKIFIPENTLHSDIAGDGIVLGVRAENRLVCVRVLTFNKDTISEYKEKLGGRLAGNVVCSDGCIVDAKYRGNNLQLLTWFRIEPLLHGKYDCVVATVSPENLVSLKNMLSCGYVIVSRANMYGGYERFIVRKILVGVQCIQAAKSIEINIEDRERMAALLSEGYVGYKIKHRPIGVNILLGQEE